MKDATAESTRPRVVTDSMKRQTKLKGKTGDRYLQHVAKRPHRSDKGQTKKVGASSEKGDSQKQK